MLAEVAPAAESGTGVAGSETAVDVAKAIGSLVEAAAAGDDAGAAASPGEARTEVSNRYGLLVAK